MKIFGKDFKKDEILKTVGAISQTFDVKPFEYIDGESKGLRAISVKSISGLDFDVLIDRGMDVSSLYYKSIPLFFKSKVKETSPFYFESRGLEFLRIFYAGFLTTGSFLIQVGLVKIAGKSMVYMTEFPIYLLKR